MDFADEVANMNEHLIDRVVEEMQALPETMQAQVLRFAEMLRMTAPQGVSGRQLLAFAGAISPTDLDEMRVAIEDGCEEIDDSEW